VSDALYVIVFFTTLRVLNLHQIASAATTHLTPVTLELGGKDPSIILPGTDIEKYSSTWMRGILFVLFTLQSGRLFMRSDSQNAGQNCIGIERLLVHRSQYDEVYNLMLERARALRVGAAVAADGVGTGVDMGSMVSQLPFQRLEDLINAARSEGARIEQGGARVRHPYLENGAYFAQTVIGEVTVDMKIAQEECASFPFLFCANRFTICHSVRPCGTYHAL
jgi:acyl-CoA reductase-like NAD-dependent aldehyde dehydrogenase